MRREIGAESKLRNRDRVCPDRDRHSARNAANQQQRLGWSAVGEIDRQRFCAESEGAAEVAQVRANTCRRRGDYARRNAEQPESGLDHAHDCSCSHSAIQRNRQHLRLNRRQWWNLHHHRRIRAAHTRQIRRNAPNPEQRKKSANNKIARHRQVTAPRELPAATKEPAWTLSAGVTPACLLGVGDWRYFVDVGREFFQRFSARLGNHEQHDENSDERADREE